jgi:cytochrome c oxidase subunit 2
VSHQPGDYKLDAAFWRATAVLGIISIAGMVLTVVYPIDRLLREAASSSYPIDFLFRFMIFFSVPIFVFVNGYIVYFAWRYRRRKDEPIAAVGSSIHDHRALEDTWTVVPSILMVVLGILSYLAMPQYYLRDKNSAATIEAIGHENPWYFEFRYPGLKQSVRDDMYLPVGIPVNVDLTSAEADESKAVIHSFWVPEFRVKQDMVPGMIVPIHFTPTKIGTYKVICAEFCGVGHGKMWGYVHVVAHNAFDRWYALQQKRPAPGGGRIDLATGNAAAGQTVFQSKCSVCHNPGPFDQRKVGPGLADLFNDPKHPKLVNATLANPQDAALIIQKGFQGDMGVMPSAQANGLSNKDIADLIAYLKTLK